MKTTDVSGTDRRAEAVMNRGPRAAVRVRRVASTARAGLLAAGVVAAAATLAGAGGQKAAPADSADLVNELARLQRSTALLGRRLELARGKEFYLVLDPAGPTLALMLRGAELKRYPVIGVQVGRPRVAWFRRDSVAEWQGVIWSAGELDPPRQVDRLVVVGEEPGPDDEDPEPPPIPPTAEELYPVPSRYHVRFEGGLSLEIRPREADGNQGRAARAWAWWTAKWRDAASALRASGRDAVRLRVVMSPKDAEALYRALPPATRLIVLDGDVLAPQ